jgi:hypothetical protein
MLCGRWEGPWKFLYMYYFFRLTDCIARSIVGGEHVYVVVGKGVNRMKGEALNDGWKGGGGGLMSSPSPLFNAEYIKL